MAYPAAPGGGLGDAGAHGLKKRKRPVQRVIVAVQTCRHVFGKFFGIAVLVGFGMHAGFQKALNILMGKFRFTGWLHDMALDEAVHFFSGIVGNLLNIRVTPFALNFGMHTLVKDVLVHIKQPKATLLVDPAEAGILVT